MSPLEETAKLTTKSSSGEPNNAPNNNFNRESAANDSMSSSSKKILTCVIVGDGGVGKTSLVISYISNGFPSEYIPTAFDKYSVLITINGEPYDLHICDTAGQSDFDLLRPFCYPSVDVFVLCYSVIKPSSMKNIRIKWLKELRLINLLVPIILIGTQQDLRNDVKVLLDLAKSGQKPTSEDEGKSLAKEIGAAAYVECSALTQKNLKEAFDVVIGAGLRFAEMGRPSKEDDKLFRFSRFSLKRTSVLSVHVMQKNLIKMQTPYIKSWWRRTFCCCI